MRPSEGSRGAAGASGRDEEADEERVYRPLLFQSTGYASSELFRDSYEMHSRLPTVSSTAPLLGVETISDQNQKSRHAVELPGGVCKDDVRREPCIEVDKARNVAQWAAYVANVSRYTGSIEIKLDVREQVNTSTSAALIASIVESNTFQELERVGAAWTMDRYANRAKDALEDEAASISELEDGDVDEAIGFVLTYDARLYGIDHDVTPVAKDLVADERNQSIWVECRTGGPCEIVRLLEITQDVDRLSFAEAFFYVFWLSLMDQHSGDFLSRRCSFVPKLLFGLVLFTVDTGMTLPRMPKLFDGMAAAHGWHHDKLYVLLGFMRTGLILLWLVWIMVVVARSGRHLKALPYMATRFKQLSYRFLVLETLLIFVYVFVLSALQVFFLTQTWYIVGYDAFIQDAVHTFAKMHTGHPSLGKFLFLSVYVYLVMFVHLPPLAGDSTGLLASTAFNVDEKPRVDSYGFLTPESNLFCVETAGWLLELAYQAYFDPPGCPSSSGYGELTLERYGFELITHLRTYESIRDELKEVTRLILDENPGVSVYITGHSMGGALAILAAYDLAVNFSIKVNMYNFGGPRVGNPSFRQHYDSCVPMSYRVVMDGDIVPGWPKFWGLYQHVGTEISLDVAGNLIVDPSFVERHLHNSSRRKTTMHGTNVYRVSIAKCLENLTS
ncbi:unnamed protein product [Phytophthora lilii]|uniref:Unnamed protein product n=1 Tax=Phytophthora lilii TaxID=2077276 RepID=A0A9W6UBM6_9STRA|nr:unnamed protein product [Phytophthora lilii]